MLQSCLQFICSFCGNDLVAEYCVFIEFERNYFSQVRLMGLSVDDDDDDDFINLLELGRAL